MTSHAKIPDWAMEDAGRVAKETARNAMRDPLMPYHISAQPLIARALLAAEQRGRKAGIEEAATVADADDGKALGGFGNPDFGPNVARRIAAAIRSLGEKP